MVDGWTVSVEAVRAHRSRLTGDEKLVSILLSVSKSFVAALPERVQELCRRQTRTL